MGFGSDNGANGHDPVASSELKRARFGAYFPRVFACAHSLTADETAAREAAVEAFSHAFAGSDNLGEDEFAVVLFSAVRDQCRGVRSFAVDNENLDRSERELLALVFDARLNREVIRRVLQTTEQAISSALLAALRKVKAGMPSIAVDPSMQTA
jgi:flagellar biosynthesis/type III secretory pathway protein FliH